MLGNSSEATMALDLSQGQRNETHSLQVDTNDSGSSPESVETQVGVANPTEAIETTEPETSSPGTESTKAKKQAETLAVLSTVKAAVKLYEALIGFDKNAEAQRLTIRDLLAKQSATMENKLHGIKAGEGEDFDSISKLLRRENNRLDSMLDGKDSLVTSTRSAIDAAVDALTQLKTRIIRMEEEG